MTKEEEKEVRDHHQTGRESREHAEMQIAHLKHKLQMTRDRLEALEQSQAELASTDVNHERLRLWEDSISEGLLVGEFSRSGKDVSIIEANSAILRILKYRPQDVLGRPIIDFVEPSERARLIQRLHHPSPQAFAVLMSTADASPVELEVEARHTTFQNQKVCVMSMRDISRWRSLSRQRNERLAMISHELRTPMTSIYGVLEMLEQKEGHHLTEHAAHLLHLATRNAKRMTQIVDELAALIHVDSVAMEYQFETLDLVELLKQSVAVHRYFEHKYETKFKLETEETCAHVRADGDRLVQAMGNLLINAAKYSPSEQAVCVRLERHHQVWWRISVTDGGSGIPPAFRDRVFQRFSRSLDPSNICKEGVGMGLSITKAIINDHGGEIDFRVSPDSGTTFFFDLPGVGASQGTYSQEDPC